MYKLSDIYLFQMQEEERGEKNTKLDCKENKHLQVNKNH